ncbi:MAG: GDSL-type esterase/lipase family protein [Myxococcota bacterium]
MSRRLLAAGLKPAFSLALLVLLLELGLRLLPSSIPPGLLARFQSEIRGPIARQRGLPTNDDVRYLDRTDGGPPLRLWKPGARITMAYGDVGSVPTVEMDGIGFPNPPGLAERATFDVVAIGDSFTFCTNVTPVETWPHQLAAITGMSVLNLGKGAIGPYAYLEILRRYGLEKRPRIVVMNVYEGNDLRDATRYRRHREQGAGGADGVSHEAPSISPRRSYAINLIGALAEVVFESITPPEADFRYRVTLAGGRSLQINGDNADLDEVATARALERGELDLGVWDGALAAFVALAREHEFQAVVTYSPSAYSAYERSVVFEDPSLADPMRRFSHRQREWLTEAAERHGFQFLDLTPPLQARADRSETSLYFPLNRHYAQAGHRAVAEILAETLNSGTGIAP